MDERHGQDKKIFKHMLTIYNFLLIAKGCIPVSLVIEVAFSEVLMYSGSCGTKSASIPASNISAVFVAKSTCIMYQHFQHL